MKQFVTVGRVFIPVLVFNGSLQNYQNISRIVIVIVEKKVEHF